jgi:fructose-1,6-bisphosphatase/inositol monophosphatase family enzyme
MAANICFDIAQVFVEFGNLLSTVTFKCVYQWQKEDYSFVTALDIELQNRIVSIITRYFPDHRILYEEGEQLFANKRSEYTWVVDPIDGTKNFIDGRLEYSVSIGLMHRNIFIAAYIYFPGIAETYQAINGDGVYMNGKKYSVRQQVTGNNDVILCSRSFSVFSEGLSLKGYRPVCYRCATYSMLKVLKGEGLLYYVINTNIYDVGPMSYILQQSGFLNYDAQHKSINFTPDLSKIPVLICTADSNFISAVPIPSN